MRAMQLVTPGTLLRLCERQLPALAAHEVLVSIAACGVCRTDLHIVDGELPQVRSPIVPGHEIVGRAVAYGAEVRGLETGQRVGIPWLGWTCGVCEFCRRGEENLCPNARFTGYQIDGGYADATIADARYVFPLPPGYSDEEAAPLLCAGLIGWRALRMAGEVRRLGIYGFGAAGHIIIQAAKLQGQEVYAFVRPGDHEGETFARALGAVWAGPSTEKAPEQLDAAIIFAPVGELVPLALAAVRPGGRVVCAGIHMSDIPSFPYALLWGERVLRSVANLTRKDASTFLAFATKNRIHTATTRYHLEDANLALNDLRGGKIQGAAVLVP